eukprot:TRINITY_DN81808_c0_g1_i1.p1 TRINITY_DN81808_c0_g1~~TRINITY_DN81808_c0_g1_i1.p1  ORF type:complete len:137 (+),score=25.52 TRINITY_DN81808_c0_g1_i1:27-437(+)
MPARRLLAAAGGCFLRRAQTVAPLRRRCLSLRPSDARLLPAGILRPRHITSVLPLRIPMVSEDQEVAVADLVTFINTEMRGFMISPEAELAELAQLLQQAELGPEAMVRLEDAHVLLEQLGASRESFEAFLGLRAS